MKKFRIIISAVFIFICGQAVHAQQKPSQKPITEEINKINQKRSLRYKMVNQNNLNVQEASTQESTERKQVNQQGPVNKVSDKPIKVPARTRKQQ